MEWIPDWLVDFQTSKLVGFIGAGDTLERFGLQESNCSHIFLKEKDDARWICVDLLRWQVQKRRASRGSSGSWPEA